ncbi:MAG: IS200/IS605 family transposase, partial [Clostridia bacterium]
NEKKIAAYVRNQITEDRQYEQLSMKELVDPFTGEPVTKDKK